MVMTKACNLICKVSLKPYFKQLLILSAILNWRWLTDKCFTIEVLTGDTVYLDSK